SLLCSRTFLASLWALRILVTNAFRFASGGDDTGDLQPGQKDVWHEIRTTIRLLHGVAGIPYRSFPTGKNVYLFCFLPCLHAVGPNSRSTGRSDSTLGY